MAALLNVFPISTVHSIARMHIMTCSCLHAEPPVQSCLDDWPASMQCVLPRIKSCIRDACSFEARPARTTQGLTLRPQVPGEQCVDMLVCEDGRARACTFLHTMSQPAFTLLQICAH